MNLTLESKESEANMDAERQEKIPVFGLLKRNGKVFVKIVPNCSKEVLMSIIKGKYSKGRRFIRTDGNPTTDWFSMVTNIIGCFIRRMNLPVESPMSKELNLFGRSPKDGSQNSTVAKMNFL
jgi:hypothetical protein